MGAKAANVVLEKVGRAVNTSKHPKNTKRPFKNWELLEVV